MNEELLPDEIEALWYIWWVAEPIATLIDLSYGCCDLSQGSTQAWWEAIREIAF